MTVSGAERVAQHLSAIVSSSDDAIIGKDLNERTGDHEILFDLGVGRPRGLRSPCGDVGSWDHSSNSKLALTMIDQRGSTL